MIQRLRAVIRWLLLRGRVLTWWVAHRARQWEQAYCTQLLRTEMSAKQSGMAPSLVSGGKLHKLVFIADCMWEHHDLLPELRKIAEVAVLDLRPKLAANPGSLPAHELCVSAVQEFVAAQKNLAPDLVFLYARPALLSEELFACLRRQ